MSSDELGGLDERNVELVDVHGSVGAADFPVSNRTLTEEFGDCELRYAAGTASLREVLSRDPAERTYRSREAVRRAATRLLRSDGDESEDGAGEE